MNTGIFVACTDSGTKDAGNQANMTKDGAQGFHFGNAENPHFQHSRTFDDFFPAQVKQCQKLCNAEEIFMPQLEADNSLAAIHAKAACIGGKFMT